MPVVHGIHLFASHKGGTGKTLLSFQTSCQFALENPDIKVLIFDLTELGDLSKRFLGHNAEAIKSQCGAMFDLLGSLENEVNRGWFDSVKDKLGMKNSIDFENSVHPSEFNVAIPSNIYLVSSGVETRDMVDFDVAKYAEEIRLALETSPQNWKVFVDTDGDRRPAVFTKLGYCLSDYIVIPLCPDIADFQRLEAMIEIIEELSEHIQFHAKITQVIWNRLQLLKTEADAEGSFQLTKVESETLAYLNKKLFAISQQSSLFQHRSEGKTLEEFVASSVARVRDFPSTVSLPSNSMGIPFCCMKPGKIPTSNGGNTFMIKQEQIDGAIDNIKDVLNRLESMVQA